jgi:hypothetical protein
MRISIVFMQFPYTCSCVFRGGKKIEIRSNPQNPKNKIKIWTVYNRPRVEKFGLDWVGMGKSGGGNWTDGA